MTKVELSLFIEANYPATAVSISMRKPRYGVGWHDADYTTTPMINGKLIEDPAYRSWSNMLQRAYSKRYQEKQPTYIGVTVCNEWLKFSSFREWWLENHVDGRELDKDLLAAGNREYGPGKCIYVPRWLNAFTTDSGASRGELPIGVCIYKPNGKYHSHCRNPITGKLRNLGYFTTPAAAHEAWLKFKLELAAQLKPDMDAIDQRIYPNVVTIIRAA